MSELTMQRAMGGVSSESLERYCSNHRISFIASLLVCALLAVSLWPHVQLHTLMVWLSLVILTQIGQAWHSRRYLNAQAPLRKAQANWMPGLLLGSLATGASWGVAFFMLELTAIDPVAMLLIFTIAGISAYAGIAKSHILPLALAFEFAVLLPLSLWLFMQQGALPQYMGIIVLVYLALLYFLLRQINAMALRVHSLHTENTALSEALARVQTLERESAMFRSMFEMITEPAIAVHDPDDDMRIVYANVAACHHLGVDEETVLTLHPRDFDVRVNAEKRELMLDRLARHGRFAFQSVHRRANGEEVPVEVIINNFEHEGSILRVSFVRNIASRLAAEQRMHELEVAAVRQEGDQRIGRYLECVPGLFFTLRRERDGKISMPFARGSSASFQGLDPQAVAESIEPLLALCHPDDTSTLMAELHASALSLRPCRIEFRIGDPTIGLMTMELTAQPQASAEDAEVMEWHGFMQDISVRKRMERALDRSEQEFRSLAVNLPVAVIRYDAAQRRCYINPAAERMLHGTLEELMGRLPGDGGVPATETMVEHYRSKMAEVLASGETCELEFVLDALPLELQEHYAIRFAPELDPAGNINGVLAIWFDITERRRLEEQLKMKGHALDNSSEAMYLISEQGGFVYVNEQASRSLGYSREELLTMGVPDIDPEFSESLLADRSEKIRQEGGSFVFETRHKRCDGTLIPVEIQMSELAFGGQVFGLSLVRDITERKQAEKALHDSEAMLQEAQRIAHVGSWDVDMVNDKLTWSDEIFRIWEIDKTKFKADFAAFLETVHPDDRERVSQAYNQAVIDHSLYQVEHRLLFPDGRIKHILERGEPQYDEQGKPVRFIGTSLDITERKRMEDAMQERGDLLQAIMESSPEIIVFALDQSYRYLSFNEKHRQVMQAIWGKEIAVGMSMLDEVIGSHADREVAKHGFDRALSGEVFVEESAYGDEACSREYWQTFWSPIRSGTGEVTGLTCFVLNISERKRIEIALAARERDFRSLAGNMPDNIARWDTEGRYLYVNSTHERLLGMTLDALIGQPIPDSHEQVKAGILQVVASCQAIHAARQVVMVEGVEQLHDVSLVPEFDETGKVVSVLGIGRDMTERYRMQETIAAREQEFRSLAESAPDNIVRYDREGRHRYLNDRLLRQLGLNSLGEVVGKRPGELWPDGRFSALEEIAARVAASGERAELEFQEPDGRGGWLDYLVSVVAERNEQGEIVGTIAFGRNITHLRSTERLMQMIGDHLPGAVTQYRLRSDLSGEMLYASQGLQALYGVTKEMLAEGIGPMIERIHPDDLPRAVAEQAHAAKMLTTAVSEFRVNHPEKGEIWVQQITTPVPESEGSLLWYSLMFDISERKQAEQALVERQAFLDSLFEAIPIPVFSKDREGRYLKINRAFEHYYGADREQMIGKSVFDTHPRELAETYHAKDVEVFERRVELQQYEYQIKHSNGTLRDVLFSKAAFADAQGEVKGLIGAVMDITERKQAEIELQSRFDMIVELNEQLETNACTLEEQAVELEASQEQLKLTEAWYRGILHSAPDGMMVINERGIITLVNAQLAEMFGYAESDLVGQTMEILVPDEVRSGHSVKREKLVRTMQFPRDLGQVDNLRGRHKDGHEFAVDITLARLPDSDGNVGTICAAVRDITERKQMEEALALREQEFRSLLENTPDVVVRYDRECRRLYVNSAWERVNGLLRADVIGKSPLEISGPIRHMATELVEMLRGVVQSGVSAELELEWIEDTGEEVCFSMHATPEFDHSGGVQSVLTMSRDITQRKLMEKLLAVREQESRTLLENTPDTIARYDRDCRRLYANAALESLVEGGLDSLLGKTPAECPGGANAAIYEEKLHEVFASGKPTEFELTWPSSTGDELHSLISLTPEYDAEGQVETVLAVGRDITELNAFRDKIHQMAFYDTLTSLPNRALFNDRLRQMITDADWHGQIAGVMMIDMDRFKEVNDIMGHAVGDELLCETGVRLSACVRAYDTVARLGGDEFAILLPDIRNGDDLGGVADKLLEKFQEPFLLDGKEVFISCSIGISLYPDDSLNADDLLKFADSAMYYAKRTGRNNFRFYSGDLTESANERLMMESELRRAVERGELELHYQPKVSLADGLMIGSEALLRWNHPQRGSVSPVKFIPVAEDSGLIVELGEWVLREACRMACEMNGEGRPLHKIAINLSARQFQSNDLVRTVIDVLNETGCYPEWIELEITESLLLDEDGEVLETLNVFRALGISIAIDDFGTGYSSLSYLARFPINTLKIDRSFISTVTTEHFRAELVKAILSIAKCLGQQVVAEGVETVEQAEFLQAHGCQIAQGYLYSKPQPSDVLLALPGRFDLERL